MTLKIIQKKSENISDFFYVKPVSVSRLKILTFVSMTAKIVWMTYYRYLNDDLFLLIIVNLFQPVFFVMLNLFQYLALKILTCVRMTAKIVWITYHRLDDLSSSG